jgi:hypothetical protein
LFHQVADLELLAAARTKMVAALGQTPHAVGIDAKKGVVGDGRPMEATNQPAGLTQRHMA